MNYTDVEWCKELVMSELELGNEPQGLEDDLSAFSGTNPEGTVFYRPYLLCAQRLDSDGELLSAKGGTSFRVEPRVLAYLKRQAMLDRALKLTVPPGAEAVITERAFSSGASIPMTVVF